MDVCASARQSTWREFQRDTSTKDTVRAAPWACPEKISGKVPGAKCRLEKKPEWQKILSMSLQPGAPGWCHSTCVLSQPGRRAWACLCRPSDDAVVLSWLSSSCLQALQSSLSASDQRHVYTASEMILILLLNCCFFLTPCSVQRRKENAKQNTHTL